MCNDLLKETASDPDSLRILNLILKELGRERDITAVYVSASAARPQDVDLMRQLFGAYVRYSLQPDSISCIQAIPFYISEAPSLSSRDQSLDCSQVRHSGS